MRRGLPTLKRYLNSTFELPDRHVGWLPPAVWTGYRIIRQQGIDAIYATAPPATAAVAGHILSLLSRIPLVIDLRDGWNLHSTKPSECRSRLSDSCEERLERAITRRAHAIISTTPHYRGYLKARYPELPEEKFPTILNGFDPADFNGATGPSNASGIFTMSYLGTFYHGRTPREFLQALGGLVREGRLDPTGIRVNLIGDVHHAESAPVKEMIRSNGLDGCVTLLDPLPYREALSQMKRSDLLLLFAPEQYWYYAIPAKTFEYIAAHRPILCFGHRGATADLIRSTGTGIVVDAYNVPEIACAIDRLHARWKVCGELRHHCDTRQFERRELTRQLAAVLDSLPLQGPALNSHHVARLGNSS
jgi:glycosyltransferase involved in cell wall biosynthesis